MKPVEDTFNYDNLLLSPDAYKHSHWLQRPNTLTMLSNYMEARAGGEFSHTLFFGEQAWRKRHFASLITMQDVDQAEEIIGCMGLPFNRRGAETIATRYHGHWPVSIRAVREGTLVPSGNVVLDIQNDAKDDSDMTWVPGYLETAQMRLWATCTVATKSFFTKVVILQSLFRTCDDPASNINFRLHDFGSRAVTSWESAGVTGAAHLVNFLGTDTVDAVLHVRRYYHERCAGFSIPASEHSTVTCWGRDHELDFYRHMLKTFGQPGKVFAVVVDSYDLDNAVSHLWGDVLRQELIDSGATVVIRPDSGDPVTTPVHVIEMLMDKFGHSVNGKGFMVLPDCVRVIQGDGLAGPETVGQILALMEAKKISAENISFGMGGGLLQKINRDTQRFAEKASFGIVDGQPIDIYKAPTGDHNKWSKKGRLSLITDHEGNYQTVPFINDPVRDRLQLTYDHGKHVRDQQFSEIRKLANDSAMRLATAAVQGAV